jgi:hypothetical protein
VLTQQVQEPITESAQEDEMYIHSKENNNNNNNNNSINLFTCLTTARYGQLQPSTKQRYRLTLKNKRKHN